MTGRRKRPDAALYAGKGKVEEIAAARRAGDADLVIFNHALTGAQERNLERALECRVVDRVEPDPRHLRAARAQRRGQAAGRAGAASSTSSTRLVGGWTHLERQKGGIGLRGPGETQLETDRRLLGNRVRVLGDRLAHVLRQHAAQSRTAPAGVGTHRRAGRATPTPASRRCSTR